MNNVYKKAVLGGTFDRLHIGHQKLLDTAFTQSERVTIGLTKPHMYQQKLLAELIQDFDTRKEQLENYFHEKGYGEQANILPLDNIYGNTLDIKDIDAIFVTEENLPNVDQINRKRQELEMPEIKTMLVDYVKDESGNNITSERIRKGEIDRKGFVYNSLFISKILTLPESLRSDLQKPINTLVKTTGDVLHLIENKIVIAVGDIIAAELTKTGVTPAVSVIDFKTRRHDITHEKIDDALQTFNEQGTINPTAVEAFQKSFESYLQTKSPQTIIVDGEEDLLTLPAILLAPLGSIVLYGQFDQGIVVNNVTEDVKKSMRALVEKFD